MTATGHAIIGTVIAAKIGNPALAVPIAFASHFLADALPHWDTGTNRHKKSMMKFFTQSFIDVCLGFILSWAIITWLFPTTNLIYAFCIIIVSELPDWLTAPYLFFNLQIQPFLSIYKLQKKFDTELDLPWGFINQALVLIAIVFVAKIV
jgi:hypothetical protein